jgi:hypothetical protein
MEDENYRFKIQEVGGVTSKQDRIKRLIPLFEQGQVWLPEIPLHDRLAGADDRLARADDRSAFARLQARRGIHGDFPSGCTRTSLDALARMEEPDFKLVWPKEEKQPSDYLRPRMCARTLRMAWMA